MILSKINGGLSTLHNSTNEYQKVVVSNNISCGLFWLGASKMRITRNYQTYKKENVIKRGKVDGFSYNSRRRLMDKLSRVDKAKKPLFVTLTFADEHADNKTVCRHKSIIKAFEMRLYREYPTAGSIWRFEAKDRQSGKYIGEWFPHYHILVWNIEDLFTFRKWVAVNWWDLCGSVSPEHYAAGTSVERIKSIKGVFHYAAKYMAKIANSETAIKPKIWAMPGRVWGVWRLENIPYVKAIMCQLTEEESIKLIRYMRRFARLDSHDYKSLSIFCNPDFWYSRLADILYGIDK